MLSRLWSHLLLGATAFAVASVSIVGGVQTQAGTIVEPWIDTSNRDAVAIAHEAEYAHDVPDMDWTGNYEICDPGDSSRKLAAATVRRVNFYRAMAGVPSGVVLNDRYSSKAQHAALAMSATGRLSHSPDESFDCLTDAGAEAAANSNLYLGRTGPTAIDGYIEDPGDRNRDVGHRNTILHPPTTEIGVGHVGGSDTAYPANALWVFDRGVFDRNPILREADGFVAWPPRGFVPRELVYPRWSFGLAGADFERAEVSMIRGGSPVEIEVVARFSQPGYVPSPIIVWEPVADLGSVDPDTATGGAGVGAALDAAYDPTFDTTFTVTVDGVVVDGAEVSFSYSVTVMGDRPAPAGVGGIDGPIGVATRVGGLAARGLATLAIGPLG